MPKAEAAALRAMALDPASAEGYSGMGFVQLLRGNWAAAADLYARALAIDANNPDALHHYSGALADLGYVKQALPLRRRLQVIEPFVPVFNSDTLRTMFVEGRTDVIAAADDLSVSAPPLRARVLAAQGRYGEAADVLLSIPADNSYVAAAREAVARMLRRAPTAPDSAEAQIPLGAHSWVYLYVGIPTRALEFYENQVTLGFFYAPAENMTIWAQPYQALRKTERFKAFVRNAGMVDYWRARGWPDLCRPVGADDFVCD
jgi:tetratricopeptide (TPR) repeat protein